MGDENAYQICGFYRVDAGEFLQAELSAWARRFFAAFNGPRRNTLNASPCLSIAEYYSAKHFSKMAYRASFLIISASSRNIVLYLFMGALNILAAQFAPLPRKGTDFRDELLFTAAPVSFHATIYH